MRSSFFAPVYGGNVEAHGAEAEGECIHLNTSRANRTLGASLEDDGAAQRALVVLVGPGAFSGAGGGSP